MKINITFYIYLLICLGNKNSINYFLFKKKVGRKESSVRVRIILRVINTKTLLPLKKAHEKK